MEYRDRGRQGMENREGKIGTWGMEYRDRGGRAWTIGNGGEDDVRKGGIWKIRVHYPKNLPNFREYTYK
jgi:hypothetical protein